MNRTLKEGTVRHYETHPPAVQRAPRRLLAASNFAKRLNALCGLEAVCKAWAGESHRFRRDPILGTKHLVRL
jgi:hypothetical protein